MAIFLEVIGILAILTLIVFAAYKFFNFIDEFKKLKRDNDAIYDLYWKTRSDHSMRLINLEIALKELTNKESTND